MQRPKQEGLGAAFGGGVTDQVFGARTTDVLQKATWYLGSLFFLLCFSLAILIGKQNKQKPLLDPEKPVAKAVEKSPTPDAVPTTPPASLVNELAPATPGTTTPTETPAPPATQPE
jgi:preprotein translocase subunit SecG